VPAFVFMALVPAFVFMALVPALVFMALAGVRKLSPSLRPRSGGH